MSRLQEYDNNRAVVLIDIRAAYDCVLHDKLFEILSKRALELYPTSHFLIHLINVLKYQYQTSTMSVGAYAYASRIGVTQGSVLSPDLFNLYLEDLIKHDKILL
jgi:hypothetical protein